MLYLNKNEEKIINKFIEVEDKYAHKPLTLIWSDGSKTTAEYDSFIEDESDFELDDKAYEEFQSFVFEIIEVFGEPPIEISDDGYFLVNYHNFSAEILANGEKIN